LCKKILTMIRLKQTLIILLFSAVLALVINGLSSSGIPYKGNWPSAISDDSIAVPPSAEEGDPPFISLDEAAAIYQTPRAVYLDARDPEDYMYGHIKGALNIPYDYLPEDNIEEYWEEIEQKIPKDALIVTYCSGTECETSLFLARDLVSRGYEKVRIFFGGWREWQKAGLPTVNGE